MSVLLEFSNVTVRLARRTVLDAINLRIGPGEFTVVLGRNGAGKSTLLRAAAGLVPVSGAISWSCALAYLPQNGGIAWPMPVRDVIGLGRAAHRDGPKSDARIVDELLNRCDLVSLATRQAVQLSGGEMARVLLARALAVRAPLLLLDEPVAGLDPAHQIATMNLLRDETRQGHAIAAVLHDITLALRYATRLILIDAGRLMADITPQEAMASGILGQLYGIDVDLMRTGAGLPIAGFRGL